MRSNCTHASKIQFWKPISSGDDRIARTCPISSASLKNSPTLAVYYWTMSAKQHPPVRDVIWAWKSVPRAHTAVERLNVKLRSELLWEHICKISVKSTSRARAAEKHLGSNLRLKLQREQVPNNKLKGLCSGVSYIHRHTGTQRIFPPSLELSPLSEETSSSSLSKVDLWSLT